MKADLAQTRKHLKHLTPYAIAHLEALLERYEPLYPRLTKSSRHDEIDAREVAFRALKVAYDSKTGYLGYKVNGDEFKVDCTKYDKILMVFKDGRYRMIELPEKLFVGPDVIHAGLPERDRVRDGVLAAARAPGAGRGALPHEPPVAGRRTARTAAIVAAVALAAGLLAYVVPG